LALLGAAAISTVSLVRRAAAATEVASGDLIRPDLMQAALAAAKAEGFDAGERMVIVDFKVHSSRPRLFVLTPKTGAVKAMHCAHGVGSDEAHTGYAKVFSNVPESGTSSLGAYRILGQGYGAKHGPNLLIDGLESSNDKARERAIIIHSAWYADPAVIKQQGKMGRSNGCFVTSDSDRDTLFEMLKPGMFLYAGV